MAGTDFNLLFSSTTPGATIVYAFASSTINMFAASIPFWIGWIGILAGLFAAMLLAAGIWIGISWAIAGK